jgi:inner membrane protein
MKLSFGLKVLGLALVLFILQLCLAQVTQIVRDRESQQQVALSTIGSGKQHVIGPVIQTDCTEEWQDQSIAQSRKFTRYAAPKSMQLSGEATVDPRSRGIYTAQVFNLKSSITAQWDEVGRLAVGRDQAQHPGSQINCGTPKLWLAVADARGIRASSVKINEQILPVKVGTDNALFPRGTHVVLGSALLANQVLKATIELELSGTESLSVVPLANEAEVKLSANWPHPSFVGTHSPITSGVRDGGFDAVWKVSSLASNAKSNLLSKASLCGQHLSAAQYAESQCLETLAVNFINPINAYSLADRATKYGILFIVLTFVTVGLFEFLHALRVHPIQYFFVGAAVSIFFLLLVSLSEHIAFGQAYALAATACTLLLTVYGSYLLQSKRLGLPLGAGIAVLYGLLYALLQLEQTALLVGSVSLFIVLAIIMWITRRVDWYALLQTPKGPPAPVV